MSLKPLASRKKYRYSWPQMPYITPPNLLCALLPRNCRFVVNMRFDVAGFPHLFHILFNVLDLWIHLPHTLPVASNGTWLNKNNSKSNLWETCPIHSVMQTLLNVIIPRFMDHNSQKKHTHLHISIIAFDWLHTRVSAQKLHLQPHFFRWKPCFYTYVP